jgi:hypothetical protein
MCSLISRENDGNCVVDNMFTVFWFNKQNEFEKKIHIMMGGTIKIFLAIPVPSILQLLLPDVVKEHLSRFPYGPGAEIRKTI